MKLFVVLTALAVAVDAWHPPHAAMPTSRRPRAAMAMPDGVQDGFRGDDRKKAEAEEAFGVTVSTDPALWDDNEFTQYAGGGWAQVGIDRVSLLNTYLALTFLTKLSCTMEPDGNEFEEFVTLPLFGKQSHNRWVVHGYVSPSVRIIRALDGSASYGQWHLMSLEPDSSPTRLTYYIMQQSKAGCAVSFERE
eukprot:650630-Prymnesium_polylepis.1